MSRVQNPRQRGNLNLHIFKIVSVWESIGWQNRLPNIKTWLQEDDFGGKCNHDYFIKYLIQYDPINYPPLQKEKANPDTKLVSQTFQDE